MKHSVLVPAVAALSAVTLLPPVGAAQAATGTSNWSKTIHLGDGPSQVAATSFAITVAAPVTKAAATAPSGTTGASTVSIPADSLAQLIDATVGAPAVAIPITLSATAQGAQQMDWAVSSSTPTGDFTSLSLKAYLNPSGCSTSTTGGAISGVSDFASLTAAKDTIVSASQSTEQTQVLCLVIAKPDGWAEKPQSYTATADATSDVDLNGDGTPDTVTATAPAWDVTVTPSASTLTGKTDIVLSWTRKTL